MKRLAVAAIALLAACAQPKAVEAPTEIPVDQVDASAPRVTMGLFLAITEIDAGGVAHDIEQAGARAKCNAACLKLIIESRAVDEACVDLCMNGLFNPDCVLEAKVHAVDCFGP